MTPARPARSQRAAAPQQGRSHPRRLGACAFAAPLSILLAAWPAPPLAHAQVPATPAAQRISIVAPRQDGAPSTVVDLSALEAGRSWTTVDGDDLAQWSPGRLEDLTGLLPGTVAEPLNAGLSTAVKIRGFAVSRLHYGGMPDIQRMHSRDLATVDRVEVLRGPAAALLGITSPGGAVNYLGKRPGLAPRTSFELTAGSDDHVRLTIDAAGSLGGDRSGLRYRLVGAAEDGEQPWASLPRRRQTAMFVVEHDYGDGLVGVDLQGQRNHTPFSFGTVITNGGAPGSTAVPARVAWDRLFVLDGGAPAERLYRQAQAYWRHRFAGGAELHADAAAARVARDETLIGYWTLVSPDTVSSYYTQYRDRYRQASGRVELRLPLDLGGLRHEARLGADGYRQRFLFEGVQHIGALTTLVDAPDFSALDPTTLELWPRYNDERIAEEGAWLADRVRIRDTVEVSAAVRRQRYTIDADRVGSGRTRAAAAAATTWFAGADWRFAEGWRGWASRASGMEPNRGATVAGDFLPPQVSRQTELGAEWATAALRASAALWRIRLDNVAMPDPADRTAVIAAGSRRVQGLDLIAAWARAGWTLSANASLMRSRHLVKTRSSFGDRLVGVPDAVGGLQLRGPVALAGAIRAELALALTAVGPRLGDAANTVRVAGFVRADASLTLKHGAQEWLLGVRNLGDIRYVESVTAVDDVFQGPRRQWWLGLRASL